MNKEFSIHKFNTELLKQFWINKNIELMPIKKRHLWYMRFRFINEDYKVVSTTGECMSNSSVYYNCAMYVANYLLSENAISEEEYDNYINQMYNLYNNSQCYN